MKYLKTYEKSNERKLQVGDYVICEDRGIFELANFTMNNIGQFVKMDSDGFYIIRYENVPKELKNSMVYISNNKKYYDCVIMEKSEIKHWSKNKEDLYIYLDVNKYNV